MRPEFFAFLFRHARRARTLHTLRLTVFMSGSSSPRKMCLCVTFMQGAALASHESTQPNYRRRRHDDYLHCA